MTTRRDLYRVVIVTKEPIIRFCKKKYDEHRNCMRHTTRIYLFILFSGLKLKTTLSIQSFIF